MSLLTIDHLSTQVSKCAHLHGAGEALLALLNEAVFQSLLNRLFLVKLKDMESCR